MSVSLEMLRWGRGQAMVGFPRTQREQHRNFHAVDRGNRMYWCGCFREIRGVTGISKLRRNAQRKTRYNQRFRPRIYFNRFKKLELTNFG